jgi:RNA polymerase sigma-70 factor, ECF subfamily
VLSHGSAASVAPAIPGPVLDPAAIRPLPVADDESVEWLRSLRAHGHQREEAIARLHGLLLRAARFEVNRRAAGRREERRELDDIAHHAAADAMVAVLAKLDRFRGDSRFTTWAYKFALLEAGVKMRRRTWQDREVPLEPERWELLADRAMAPEREAELGELLAAVRDAVSNDLTAHQRAVLVAVTVDGVPIDVLAERLGTTRGALYKTLHDARRKLRRTLAAQGLHPDSDPSAP